MPLKSIFDVSGIINTNMGMDWNEELFNDQREVTYDNNLLRYSMTGSEMIITEPTPGYWTTGPGYYPPKTATMEPIYDTYTIYGWKEVDYESNKPKIKTRLVR